jgi:hypothetical protein
LEWLEADQSLYFCLDSGHNGCKTHQLLGFLAYESSKSTKLMVNLDKYNLINYK